MAIIPSFISASNPETGSSGRADLIAIGIFACLLMAPLLARPKHLWRCLFTTSSSAATLKSPSEITSAIASAFPYRKRLLRGYNQFRLQVFGCSLRSVVIGQEGWLYYDSDPVHDGVGMTDFLGQAQVDAAQRSAWRDEAIRRQEWFSARGSEYLLVIAPNKQSLYPEFLPPHLASRRSPQSRISSCLESMRQTLTLEPIFLLPQLEELKATDSDPLFLQTDTHWNALGAWCAYRAIVGALPTLRNTPALDLDGWQRERRDWSGDIAAMALMQDRYREDALVLIPDRDYPAVLAGTTTRLIAAHNPPATGGWHQAVDSITSDPHFSTTVADASLPTGVVFTDSFGEAVAPFLAQHFRSCTFVRGRLDPVLIQALAPDTVVQLQVERYLDRALAPLKSPDPAVNNGNDSP